MKSLNFHYRKWKTSRLSPVFPSVPGLSVRASYEKALALASQEPDRRFLARRLAELK